MHRMRRFTCRIVPRDRSHSNDCTAYMVRNTVPRSDSMRSRIRRGSRRLAGQRESATCDFAPLKRRDKHDNERAAGFIPAVGTAGNNGQTAGINPAAHPRCYLILLNTADSRSKPIAVGCDVNPHPTPIPPGGTCFPRGKVPFMVGTPCRLSAGLFVGFPPVGAKRERALIEQFASFTRRAYDLETKGRFP